MRERFGIPVVFYDGDVPMSLPEFGGMDTGFNYYHGADPSEYDLVLSNSEGGLPRLLELGARRAEAVFWGADPEFFAPQPVAKEMDVFFYGYGDKFRQEWTAAMVGEPSRAAPEIDFALGGRDFRGDTGNAREIGDVPFNVFARAISAARINLNVTRRSHATVPLSSTCRPFELASAGAAIVSNPHAGIEQWFEPGSEIIVVEDAGAGARRLSGAARRSGPGRGDGRPRPRARARRAHLCPPRPPRARPPRLSAPGDGVSAGRIVAIVPAHNEAGAIGGVVDAIRAFDPSFDVVVVDDGSHDETAAIAAVARRGRRDAAVQPRHRRRGADRVQVRARARLRDGGATRRRRPARSRASCRSCSRRSSAARRTSSPARASRTAAVTTARRFARRIGIIWFARLVSLLTRQRVTDTTSGFQALNRKGIALFAGDYPSDYPEVEATVLVFKHRLRLVEVPVTMRERETGSRRSRSSARSTTC